MYRIEVAPGEETVFRTLEELAVGIRNGLITPRARIYHNASQKWLPIGLHPHYKKAMELPAASAAHPSKPTPTPVPASRSKPRIESHAPEPPAEPKPRAAERIPGPMVSPVVAMQQEVLRDLPVVAIPEPLPWSRQTRHEPAELAPPAPSVVPPPQAVQAPARATLTFTPRAPVETAVTSIPQFPVEPAPAPEFAHADATFPSSAPTEPLEETHPRPTARRSRRPGGGQLLLLGVAAALVLAAHFGLTAAPPASADATEVTTPEDAVTEPAESEAPAEKPASEKPASEKPASEKPASRTLPPPADPTTTPQVTSSPARVQMTPGPAFTGSVPAQRRADTAAPRTGAAIAPPKPTPTPAEPPAPTTSIAPAPVELDLAMPDLRTDSVAPRRSGDTLAMKKILRALNGTKP